MGRGYSLFPNPTLYVFAILFILVFSEKLLLLKLPNLSYQQFSPTFLSLLLFLKYLKQNSQLSMKNKYWMLA